MSSSGREPRSQRAQAEAWIHDAAIEGPAASSESCLTVHLDMFALNGALGSGLLEKI